MHCAQMLQARCPTDAVLSSALFSACAALGASSPSIVTIVRQAHAQAEVFWHHLPPAPTPSARCANTAFVMVTSMRGCNEDGHGSSWSCACSAAAIAVAEPEEWHTEDCYG